MSQRAPLGPLSTLTPADSVIESSFGERFAQSGDSMSRWMGWRLRLLVLAALCGCLGLFLLAREMASLPRVDAGWRTTAENRIELVRTSDPVLEPLVGQVLVAVQADGRSVELRDALTLQRSARWVVDDADRARHHELQAALYDLLSQPAVQFVFAGGRSAYVQTSARGWLGLPAIYWLLSALALAVYLVALVVLLAKPNGRNLLYALIALCQAGNLVFIAMESTADLAMPHTLARLDLVARFGFDLLTAAAIVHAAAVHPRRLPGATGIALASWLVAVGLTWLVASATLPLGWWWVQAAVVGYGLAMVMLMSWSYQIEPHPFATVLRRFGIVTLVTWVLLTASLAAAITLPGVHHNIASVGSTVWYVFFASLIVLVPFLSRSQQILREFSLLAAVSTVATSLDLLFVAVFSLGQFASLTLAFFLSLAVYSGARQWIVNQLLGSNMLTTERMFEQLYRIAREVEAHPERTGMLLSELLRELFEPMEVVLVERRVRAMRVSSDGSTLTLPVPSLDGDPAPASGSIVLRFAHRGRRLFTFEDARLTARVVDQLRRAVAFDKAVEQGRSEERARIAQDLHDDIGARLLTLMYKAQSPEMEEYVRHTLQDLKTLTRGLAAANHRLSHAAAEWKADLTQRLTAAHVQLDWVFESDADVLLTVVQWSALTRVLRELVSNAIAHARATRVEVSLVHRKDGLELQVRDNGEGRNPRAWSHGLGLGGVRKRVKQLGGEVEWRELQPRGIGCRVTLRDLSARP
ncbi:MAG: sensor histidine kinase [Piscinibacter sp.]|uniref:sensor histidine kinase n=1 Tax=Piscinibacter sp. TaxID=1903157 RepID=UPI003D0D70EA